MNEICFNLMLFKQIVLENNALCLEVHGLNLSHDRYFKGFSLPVLICIC
jgi:hypothetical protein